ncbi:hypothetical protein X925_05930 [Petrotoga sp. 9T1HF07.CasAA.8.2]|nr:hypothetical protein X925_05930 [Petrotoga sp. 9T1HF07.CasAA.8.2]
MMRRAMSPNRLVSGYATTRIFAFGKNFRYPPAVI